MRINISSPTYRNPLAVLLIIAYHITLTTCERSDNTFQCSVVTQSDTCGRYVCNETVSECIPCYSTDSCATPTLRCDHSNGQCVLDEFDSHSNWRTLLTPWLALLICG
eukprot:PhF_6_TR23902/c0_g1_i1/m.33470